MTCPCALSKNPSHQHCRLKDKLPKLVDDHGEEVEFRRALLNKCQVEFEEGVVAMKAVAERELRHKDDEPAEEEASVGGRIEFGILPHAPDPCDSIWTCRKLHPTSYFFQPEDAEEGEIQQEETAPEEEGTERKLTGGCLLPIVFCWVWVGQCNITCNQPLTACHPIPGIAAAEQRKAEREAAKREVEARKRMLGNIIFVGQLYCRGVLTEKVMHSCIQQLLDEVRAGWENI